jgi:hypothetical protein
VTRLSVGWEEGGQSCRYSALEADSYLLWERMLYTDREQNNLTAGREAPSWERRGGEKLGWSGQAPF